VGTQLLAQHLEARIAGTGAALDSPDTVGIMNTLELASSCGPGAGSPSLIRSLLRYWPDIR